MQTVTGMCFLNSGEAMRRLESERLRNFHGQIVLNCRKRSYNSQRGASGKRTMVEVSEVQIGQGGPYAKLSACSIANLG